MADPLSSAGPDQTQLRQSSLGPPGTVDMTADSTRPRLPDPPVGAPDIPGYRLTAEIARGGMGRVYAGIDLTLDREVAVKTLLPGANADRFVTESKITARLTHPNIPPVYALGRLPDGTPYLAMKFVRGQTLSALLNARPTPQHDLPRFVQIFEQIAQAVGFAHSRGVIHRDLKPLNVMVGEFGEVQVMDWGLARETTEAERGVRSDDEGWEFRVRRSDLTHVGSILGTPGYMAPEQARGEPVDARADVFALGSVLAATLTGKPAFVGTTVRETIGKAAAADLADVFATLDGCGADADLIAIARRCLQPTAAERYADARELAAAVAEYRAGVEGRLKQAETERAAADVRARETRKRQRALASAGGVIAAVLVAGLGASLWQMSRAVDAEGQAVENARAADRNAAEANRQTVIAQGQTALAEDRRRLADEKTRLATAANFFLRDVLVQGAARNQDLRNKKPVLNPTVKDAMAYARRQLAGQFPDDPRLEADLRGAIGQTLTEIGDPAGGEAEFRKALALREKHSGPDHPDTLKLMSNVGRALLEQKKYADAEGFLNRARDATRRTLGPDDPDTLSAEMNVANWALQARSAAAAVPLYEAVLAGRTRVLGPDHPETVETASSLAMAFGDAGRPRDAEPLFRRVVAARLKTLPPDHPDTLRSQNNLGYFLMNADRHAEAEAEFKTVLDARKRVEGPRHPATLITQDNLALTYHKSGRPKLAEPLYRDALAGFEATSGADAPDTLNCARNLAWLCRQTDRPAESAKLFARVAAGREKSLGPDFPLTLISLRELAQAQSASGDVVAAEATLRKAVTGWERAKSDDPQACHVREDLAVLLGDAGRHVEAVAEFRKCLDRYERVSGRDSAETADRLSEYAFNLSEWKRDADAAPWLERSAAWYRKNKPAANGESITIHNRLIALYLRQDRPKDSLPLFAHTITGYETQQPNGLGTLHAYVRYGQVLMKVGDLDRAEEYLRRGATGLKAEAAKIPEKSRGPLVREAATAAAEVYTRLGREADAAAWRAVAAAHREPAQPPRPER